MCATSALLDELVSIAEGVTGVDKPTGAGTLAVLTGAGFFFVTLILNFPDFLDSLPCVATGKRREPLGAVPWGVGAIASHGPPWSRKTVPSHWSSGSESPGRGRG